MALRSVNAVRYVEPLREGGSLPAIIEADDGALYVVKFRGAGQGALALVAEVIAGEIARAIGLPVPEIVLVQIDPVLGRSEPDAEIRHLLKASVGLNVGLRYLAGATTFDPAAGDEVGAGLASLIVWFDAYLMNVDRTARNANLMLQDKSLWVIDHGASLYFHHNWPTAHDKAASRFEMIQSHILLRWAAAVQAASVQARGRLSPGLIEEVLRLVPDQWLVAEGDATSPGERRLAYQDLLVRRLAASAIFEEEIARARAEQF